MGIDPVQYLVPRFVAAIISVAGLILVFDHGHPHGLAAVTTGAGCTATSISCRSLTCWTCG
jgi:ABC-type transporter Mla maintaining outer membrane lipid asymmetry permease subunit MlaE